MNYWIMWRAENDMKKHAREWVVILLAAVCLAAGIRMVKLSEVSACSFWLNVEMLALCAALAAAGLACLKARQMYRDLERMTHDKSEFFSNMSHELRTPMNIIAGLSELTCGLPGLPEDAEANLMKLEAVARYTVGLVGEIIDVNRIEMNEWELSIEPFSLQRFMKTIDVMMTLQAEQSGVRLNVEQELEHPWVYGDELRLRQVIINLMSNAIKFTPPGGKIVLSIRESKADEKGASYAFAVSDTGNGIAPADRERIFKAFEQVGNKNSRMMGTGLGLPISRMIVEKLGGEIHLESEVGRGSCFSFNYRMDFAAPQTESESTSIRLDGMRVLVADDNTLGAGITKELLEIRGAHVEIACNGQQTVEMFEESGPYDAILMDIKMPVMDGLEATQAIREKETGHVKIIAMSAGAFQQEIERALEAGMDNYLVKPVETQKLCRMLQSVC